MEHINLRASGIWNSECLGCGFNWNVVLWQSVFLWRQNFLRCMQTYNWALTYYIIVIHFKQPVSASQYLFHWNTTGYLKIPPFESSHLNKWTVHWGEPVNSQMGSGLKGSHIHKVLLLEKMFLGFQHKSGSTHNTIIL